MGVNIVKCPLLLKTPNLFYNKSNNFCFSPINIISKMRYYCLSLGVHEIETREFKAFTT